MHAHGRGFTLVELLIALAVVAILVGLASAAYGRATAAVHTAHAQEELLATLMAAQRASVVAGGAVVCPTTGGSACVDTADWHHGWIAFVDRDGDGRAGRGEPPLVHRGALPDGVGLQSTRGRTRLVFRHFGHSDGSNVTFTLCDRRSEATTRSLVMANSGRLRSASPGPAAAAACLAAVR